MEDLLTISVVEMAARIRQGMLSPVAVTDFFLDRIAAVNPRLNAVVVPRFAEARQEARAAEARLAEDPEDLPPLFGVPCTIKDTYAMAGLTWSGGLWKRRNKVPDFDATVVERVRQAGAIVMGKTNVPEAAMWCETYNHVYGRTNNPYDIGRGVGGSSGGEGSIIGAGASPFGIGSDVGGSIRYPSAFNGVAGHKPTTGRVPGYGHWPEAKGPLAPYNTYGPMGRRVSDLTLLLSLLQGPDGRDPIAEDRGWRNPDQVDRNKLRVFYYESNGMCRLGRDVRRAIAMCVGALQAEKLPVQYWRPRGMERSLEIWQAGMSQNPDAFDRILGDGQPLNLVKETVRFAARRSKLTFPGLGLALVEKPAQLFAARNRKMLALADDLRRRMEERLGDNGVLICPVFPTPAPKHHWIWADLPGIGYSGVFNILGFPATILPIYYNDKGLPVSVQVVAARWNDHLTLAAAGLLESIFGGWRPPDPVQR